MRKRSINLKGHKTSISIEDAFWLALQEIAASQGITPANLVFNIDQARDSSNLCSALRLYVLAYYVDQSSTQLPIEPIGSKGS